MNDYQKRFFQFLANIQESNVEICMSQNKCDDEKIRSMLYDCTYEVITEIMLMIDGYTAFSEDKLDIINTATGKCLKETPFIELHDQTCDFLRDD